MPTREQFLRLVWNEIIDAPMAGTWIDDSIANYRRDTGAAFSDSCEALQRLLEAGASPRDISLVARSAIYEAVFSLLYMFDDPGVDDGNVFSLHESLLSADPSGNEGRSS